MSTESDPVVGLPTVVIPNEALVALKEYAPWLLAASWIIVGSWWLSLIWWFLLIVIFIQVGGWVYRNRSRTEVLGKTVLITGGAMGLGKATARQFAQRGNNIVLWDIAENKLKETAAELKKEFLVSVHTYVVDVTKDSDVALAVLQVKRDVGYVDIVVLNAGVISGYSLVDLPLEKMRRVYEVNVFQLYSVTQPYLKQMIAHPDARGGHFVIISSMSAYTGINKMTDYGASKAAAVNFAEGLYAEIVMNSYKNVHHTLVCPYFINTGMFHGTTPLSFFPFLEEQNVAVEIYEGVAKKKQLVCLPWLMHILALMMKLFFPTNMAPFFDRIIGFSRAMTTFSGRSV